MHVTAKGTTRLDASDLDAQGSVPGYPKEEKEPPKKLSDGTGRLSPLGAATCRFLLHSVLWVGMSISSAVRKRISAFVGFDSTAEGMRSASDHVRYRCHAYWVECLRLSHMEPEGLAIHLVHMLEAMDVASGGPLRTHAARGVLEEEIGHLVKHTLAPRGFEKELQRQSRTLCIATLGDELWAAVEKDSSEVVDLTPLAHLWLRRKASSMDSFVTGLNSFVEPHQHALLKVNCSLSLLCRLLSISTMPLLANESDRCAVHCCA